MSLTSPSLRVAVERGRASPTDINPRRTGIKRSRRKYDERCPYGAWMDGLRCGGWSASRRLPPLFYAFLLSLLTFLLFQCLVWVPIWLAGLLHAQTYPLPRSAWMAGKGRGGSSRAEKKDPFHAYVNALVFVHARHTGRRGTALIWKSRDKFASNTTTTSLVQVQSQPPHSPFPLHLTLINHHSPLFSPFHQPLHSYNTIKVEKPCPS